MTLKPGKIIKFIRQQDYEFVNELGQGACGRTVLLHDPLINEKFVCKKYSPVFEELKDELFPNFIREIKILHQIYHRNIVRVFNYHLYPKETLGYILMEHVEGVDIEDFLKSKPDAINDLFVQAIDGFSYLESNDILHRDIRPQNILVTNQSVLKVIDFGFGKIAKTPNDFDKSISVSHWCTPPNDFDDDRYNHTTEVYFLGKLFEKIINENSIDSFKYSRILKKMINVDFNERIRCFNEIQQALLSACFDSLSFTSEELTRYRNFSNALVEIIKKIETDSKYNNDVVDLITKLDQTYTNCMLEEYVPDSAIFLNCLINGAYSYYTSRRLSVTYLKETVELLKSVSGEKQRVILANLHTKLNSIERYTSFGGLDDVPF